MHRRQKWIIALLSVIAALIAVRAALPGVIRNYVNDSLQALEDYDGAVQDVDLHLWRGAYRIDGVQIVKTDSGERTPFFNADHVDFSIDWGHLLRGKIVAEGEFVRPRLNLVQAEDPEESQTGADEDWARQIQELFPFRINELVVRDGAVTFRAPGIQAKDALTAEQLNARLVNLTNTSDADEENFARFEASARVLDEAPIRINGSLNPLAEQPTFDVNLALESVQLPSLNPWLREFINADAEAGQFQLYLELAAAEGKFKGYAKPLMQHVNMHSSEEPEDNPLRRLWEGALDFAAEILENDEEDQVGARVPFSGTIENPESSVLETIVSVLRNAFVSAFARSLEGSISLRDVKDNLSDVGQQEEKGKG